MPSYTYYINVDTTLTISFADLSNGDCTFTTQLLPTLDAVIFTYTP